MVYLLLLIGFLSWIPAFAHSVVIVGAGPMGLATALASAQEGADVIVLEKRLPQEAAVDSNPWASRKRNVVLDQETVDYLKSIGVELPGQDFKKLYLQSGEQTFAFNAEGPGEAARRSVFLRPPKHYVELGALENAILDAVQKKSGGKVKIIFGAENVTLDPDFAAKKVYANYSLNGKRFSFEASTGFAADGANSSIVAQLGIGRSAPPQGHVRRQIAGDFLDGTKTAGSFAKFRFDPKDNIAKFTAAFSVNGTTSVSIPAPMRAPGMGREEYTKLANDRLQEMARRLGVTGKMGGNYTNFSNEIDAANSVRQGQVFIIGDAARKGNPWTGQGIQTGFLDVRASGQFIKTAVNEPKNLEAASSRLEKTINGNTERLHLLSNTANERGDWFFSDPKHQELLNRTWRQGSINGMPPTAAISDNKLLEEFEKMGFPKVPKPGFDWNSCPLQFESISESLALKESARIR